MLKTRVINNDISINNFIVSEDYTSDRDFYNNKLLNLGVEGTVNGIIDSEIYEYKPETSSELNFNIFFLKYLQETDIAEITPYIESAFSEHVLNTKKGFGLVPLETGSDFGIAFSNAFETKQDNGLRESTIKDQLQLTKSEAVSALPYHVSDHIGLANIVTPKKSGLPIFYNSFTIPYWDKKDSWITNNVLYKNKPFFYNSFLLMEFFDSPAGINQTRVQSVPIFINNKYNIKEKSVLNNVIHERPCFNLKEGDEGYSFFFLDNYIKNEFYVKFSFWDALNGKKILLVPSSKQEKSKKWFQKSDGFKNEIRYLKYVLDFETKRYNIFEYDIKTDSYTLERTDFDLYELAYDEYFNKNIIKNTKPVDVDLTPTKDPLNPLSFRIKNLILDNYQGDKHSTPLATNIVLVEEFVSDTYVYGCGELINSFTNYIANKPNNLFINFQRNEYTVPIYNDTVNGYSDFLRTIIASNIDDITWKIRKLELNNISVITDSNTYNTTYYTERETDWDVTNKYRVAEALVIPDTSIYKQTTLNSSIYSFSEEMFNSIDFFDILIDVLDSYLITPRSTSNFRSFINLDRPITVDPQLGDEAPNYINYFLDELFNSLRNYNDELNPKILKFDNYTAVVITDANGNITNPGLSSFGGTNTDGLVIHSCLYPHISKIKQTFHSLKTTDYDAYNAIKNMCALLLHQESLVFDYEISNDVDGNPIATRGDLKDRLPYKTISKINGNFSPSDYPKLLKHPYLYNANYSPQNLNQNDYNIFNGLDLNYLNLNFDVINQTANIRDYLFDVLLIYNGDNHIEPNEGINIQLRFSVGNKVFDSFYYTEEIRIKGTVKISLMNNNGDIKNIYIPLNAAIKATKKSINFQPAQTITPIKKL